MTKRKWFLGSVAVFAAIILCVWFFFPSGDLSSGTAEKERKVNFLEVDPHWADSLIKTMSLEEKAAMLILYVPDENKTGDSVFLKDQIPGGYLLSASNILSNEKKIPAERSLIFATYTQVPVVVTKKMKLPEGNDNSICGNPEIFFSVSSDSLLSESKKLMAEAADYHQLDGVLLPQLNYGSKRYTNRIYHKDTALYAMRIKMLHDYLSEQNILTSSGCLAKLPGNGKKTSEDDSVEKTIRSVYNNGVPVMLMDSLLENKKEETNSIPQQLERKWKFKGLCFAAIGRRQVTNVDYITRLFDRGTDMMVTSDFGALYLNLKTLLSTGKIKEKDVDARVKKILLAKTWAKMRKKKVAYEKKEAFTAYEKSFPRRFRKAAFTLMKNDKNYLPIRNITNNRIAVVHLGHQPTGFTQQLYHYLPKEQTVPTKTFKEWDKLAAFNPGDFKRYHTVVVTIYGNLTDDKTTLEKLNQIAANSKLIILNFCHPENIPLLSKFSTVVQLWGNSVIEHLFSAQSLMGAVAFESRLPIGFDKKLKLEKSKKLAQSRLQYTIPEDVGISSDSLTKIDYIVEEGIRNKAFPGAQVFFAIDGKVFFNRSYGTHIYTEKQEVKINDLFDMASVTKVAASTIVAMSAYEKGLYQLNDSLYKHLPDTLKKHLRSPSSLRNITFKQILTHETGLAAGQPILKYIRYRDSVEGRFDKYYCDEPDDYYCVQLADKFFMEKEQLDTIWYAMNRMSVDEYPDYRYSDANMNLLYKLLNAKIKNRWPYYLDSLYYQPLGMFNTCYLPIQREIKPERIVPTENDRYWRNQLLRGYVHDPTAALFGGVAGNAGLFSTSEDMGILFQMLLFNGSYGGTSYFKKETVELFTSQQSGSHRGLGFNRQVKRNTYGVSPYASKNTFGHTGFTGISVWADKDIRLIYVSCTNRVHPDPENKKIINLGTTKRIHNVIYEQLKYVMPDKIDLE